MYSTLSKTIGVPANNLFKNTVLGIKVIYYNKEDPSIIVEKRVGIGWTVNAGTTIGMVILIVPIIIIILTLIYVR